MKIHPEIKQACQEVLQGSYDVGRFTQREFGWLDQTIQWFDEPDEDLEFSFMLAIRNGEESTHYHIEFDGVNLTIDDVRTTYDPQVGSDHFTSYSFSQSNDVINEEGDLNSWRSNALEALHFVDDSSLQVDFSITIQEE